MKRTSMLLLILALLGLPGGALVSHATPAPSVPPWPIAARPDALRLRIGQAGLVQVTPSQLAVAGWNLATLNRTQIALWYAGVEQPLTVMPTGDLQWIARPTRSRYHADAVYWLTQETRAGLRGVNVFAPGVPLAWEEDTRYESTLAAPNGDHWFATEITARDPTRQVLTATLTLPAAIPSGTPLQLDLATTAFGNHQLTLTTNGIPLPSIAWVGQGPQTVSTRVPALPAGLLTIIITAQSTLPILLDQLTLPTITPPFDILPQTPEVTPGSGYDLSRGPAPSQFGADDLIVSVPTLSASLAPLVSAHQTLGRQVALLDVQAAYDAFSYGERDPEAIRQLIRLSQTWTPAPRLVLLAGAGSVRMRVATGESDPTLIPPYLIDVDPKKGEVACDTCYTRLNSGDVRTQTVPDLPIGRLPIRTTAEADVVVSKTVTALTHRPMGAWQWHALLLSDNDTEANGTPDPAGPFTATLDAVAAQLAPGLRQTRLVYDPTGQAGEPNVAKLRCQLFRALDGGSATDSACPAPAGESGAALWVYVGHGSPWQWAATSPDAAVPYLWYLYDADIRTGGDRLPILLSLTCLTGDWANPILQTTDERLLLHPSGGTIASLSATGLGVNTTHAAFAAALLPVLMRGEPLGDAHLAGIAALPRGSDLAYTFGILGDPLVTLPLPPTTLQWLPALVR